MNRIMQRLAEISRLPASDVSDWLSSAELAVEFLKENAQSEKVVIFASMGCTLIHSVLAPLANLNPPDQAELAHDFVQLDDTWAIQHVSGGGEPDRVYLAPPLDDQGKTLKGGEKLLFKRSFVGTSESHIELSQKLVHALNVHFVQERSAYCRLDENGDLLDVINMVEENTKDWTESVRVVTILAKDLAEYMRLSEMGMVVFFDFTRTRRGSFNGWGEQEHLDYRTEDLFYHGGVMPGHASYVNGRQIVRPAITLAQIVRAHMEERNPSNRQYAVFKAVDLKSGNHIEVSCDPAALSNYFQPESSLPLEMSPVFFRSEVLHRYKADPEKYELGDRSIDCRGTWSLQTYDVNEAGQVHTYLRYIRNLPYQEQIYWQSFNEWPKAGLSRRAITTDFKGEVYTEYDPLNSLKRKIAALDESPPGWWNARDKAIAKGVHYPVTTSPAEWAGEILSLDQLINEGFQPKGLRELLTNLGQRFEMDWGPFRLVEECLILSGVQQDQAKNTVSSFRNLRELRNLLKGHAAPQKRTALEKDARTRFGSFRAHFANVATDCDTAFDLIIRILGRRS
jgi:hypothetical protein